MKISIFSNEEDDNSLVMENGEPVNYARVNSIEDIAKLLELSPSDKARLLKDGRGCFDFNGQPIVVGGW